LRPISCGSLYLDAIILAKMPPAPRKASADDTATLLAEGIRYERGGVTARALACFEEVTDRWREDPAAAAEAWWRLANQHRLQSHWLAALDAARAGATLARENDLPNHEADALNIEGAIWMTRGDYAAARPLFERTLELARTASTRAKALQNLGGIAGEERELDEAERLFIASREQYATAGDARGEAVSTSAVSSSSAATWPARARRSRRRWVRRGSPATWRCTPRRCSTSAWRSAPSSASARRRSASRRRTGSSRSPTFRCSGCAA
jgi:tetratricopeptide (TPR) repeat protein